MAVELCDLRTIMLSGPGLPFTSIHEIEKQCLPLLHFGECLDEDLIDVDMFESTSRH